MPTLDGSWPTIARISLALAGLAIAMCWERARPFRLGGTARARSDLRNLGLWSINAALLQVLPGAAAVATASIVATQQTGWLNQVELNAALRFLLTILVLDALGFTLHRLYHAVPILWRIHRVHHSEEALGATSGVRFHAIEVLLSTAVRLPVIAVIGAPVWAVVAFEASLLLASQLQHADVRLSARVDRGLRRWVVTPNLHRVHHSVERAEADSNFGTILTLWDRVFGSLRDEADPEQIIVGLPDASSTRKSPSLPELLLMPFARRYAS
jgi:sterol desaturase/sphingolipid hydroxylase (fatty acid hydroxylase superfamily)